MLARALAGRQTWEQASDGSERSAPLRQNPLDDWVTASAKTIIRITPPIPIHPRTIPADAERVGVHLDKLVYRTISELEGVSTKAIQDAGLIPVTKLD
jgi:hypothetical protein